MNEPSVAPPKLLNYLDFRVYLHDLYEFKKRSLPSFSYSSWALELGLKSRAFLRLIVTGQRTLTENIIPVFLKGLKLKKLEQDYFLILVRFNQATKLNAKEFYLKELMQFRGSSWQSTELKDFYSFLSSPLGPRIHALCTIENTHKTTAAIAHTLNVKENEVEDMLAILLRLKLIKSRVLKSGENEWISLNETVNVKDHLGNQALQAFHRTSLTEAMQAIDWPVNQRTYQTIVLALSPYEWEEVKAKIRIELELLLQKHKGSYKGELKLYQVNFNLLEVSKPILRTEKAQGVPVGRQERTKTKPNGVSV